MEGAESGFAALRGFCQRRARLTFQVMAGKGTYNAHYPIHAFAEFDYGGHHLTAHPILVLEPNLADAPRGGWQPEWKPAAVPANGSLGLWHLAVRRAQAKVVQDEPQAGAGTVASKSESRVQFGIPVARGATRQAISLRLGQGGSSLPRLIERPTGFIWGAILIVAGGPSAGLARVGKSAKRGISPGFTGHDAACAAFRQCGRGCGGGARRHVPGTRSSV